MTGWVFWLRVLVIVPMAVFAEYQIYLIFKAVREYRSRKRSRLVWIKHSHQ